MAEGDKKELWTLLDVVKAMEKERDSQSDSCTVDEPPHLLEQGAREVREFLTELSSERQSLDANSLRLVEVRPPSRNLATLRPSHRRRQDQFAVVHRHDSLLASPCLKFAVYGKAGL
ncbi:hypothetical protein CYMTET_40029 [Cymbomonas tetramitiformis]|uniref:Uncharacterized protein n=1 Tax=Cymbomonas tetramitiformis TaxID=36881 RepID=A0AAE0F3N5_9CHLO|nr:hypothetical protein CYMTET_40029 [Cymbomonas tetramitiformis]